MSKLESARDAFVQIVATRMEWEAPGEVVTEAYDESVIVESATKALHFAVEQWKQAINGCDHVGPIVSSTSELTNLLIDYEQSSVGEAAARLMAESVEEGK